MKFIKFAEANFKCKRFDVSLYANSKVKYKISIVIINLSYSYLPT